MHKIMYNGRKKEYCQNGTEQAILEVEIWEILRGRRE